MTDPTCTTCNDTHAMDARGLSVQCTRCPLPCDACRGRIGYPYFATTPCSCPECGRNWHDRVTPERLAVLRAINANPRAHVQPAMRIRLHEIGLIVAAGPRLEGGGDGRRKPENRAHVLTDRGKRVLDAARMVEQTRHDVAAAVARHADIDTLIERSSIGQGLRRIREHGIAAELRHLDDELHGARGRR